METSVSRAGYIEERNLTKDGSSYDRAKRKTDDRCPRVLQAALGWGI